MKKLLSLLVAIVLTFSLAACGKEEASQEAFVPTGDIEWVVTSSAGGGSSIFTQNIVDIINSYGFVDQTITINYQTDGGGAIGRKRVSEAKTNGHTILTFNNGDLQPYVQTEGGDLDNLTPLAVMANDGQILLVHKDYKYQTMEEIIDAINGGERIIVGGSKSDDEAIFDALKENVTGDIAYLRSDSTAEALTQLLGKHVDIAIAKPAASFDYVASGELVPVVAAGGSRFGAPFDGAPTFKEMGYDIEFEIYRGIVGPKDMTAEEVAFWSDVFKKVSETDEWKNNYISKFLLISNHKPADEAIDYMQAFEDMYTK